MKICMDVLELKVLHNFLPIITQKRTCIVKLWPIFDLHTLKKVMHKVEENCHKTAWKIVVFPKEKDLQR